VRGVLQAVRTLIDVTPVVESDAVVAQVDPKTIVSDDVAPDLVARA
jgi:hypothetical protein